QFGGIIISFSKMNRILEVDLENRCAVVEAGVFNLDLQNALAPMGYYFAPDPASQRISTIGGNIAENAGGPHCLKYGVTANHVMGIEAVLADGSIVEFGGKHEDDPGYDVAGLLVGSEGALAIITKATVRINVVTEAVKTMLAIFDDMKKAANAVTDIISRGIVPASLEMMDKPIIQTIEKAHKLGYPADADAVLVIEVDGPGLSTEQEAAEIIDLCEKNGVQEIRIAKDDREREDLWKGRRLSFGTLTQLRPSIMIADGTVPRTKLPEVLDEVIKICKKYDLNVGNVFHAGDGNLHPFIVYDERDAEEKARVFRATEEILRVCVDAGGTISGEHGIGIEKKEAMKMLFTEADFDVMRRVKRAFDPDNMLNPNKIIPVTELDNL
ncbi:MAG: FAD-linked oxidase C-terminal domain-containing protein, partial [candidate division KSB1 bacterium]|nr:FAD-linked oxidase C-terminal domain-containing protein [candidate division KSB1 bacterium]